VLRDTLFAYTIAKYAHSDVENFTFPILKVFMSKLDPPSIETSNICYLGLLDEHCDSKDTVMTVLGKLYEKMEVGTKYKYLVVVGDGKTYYHLQNLKDEYGEDLAWLLNYPGDWHILKNYSLALLKVYGPPGLNELLSMFHKGSTANSVINCTDFDKTFDFLTQSWEAISRLMLEMFLSYYEGKNTEEATSAFSSNNFIAEVKDIMSVWQDTTKSHTFEEFKTSYFSLLEKIKPLKTEYDEYVAKMCSVNETFKLWHHFVHVDAFAYITFYIAGRCGNWFLRNYALKTMIPIFHCINSTYYYRLLPRHLGDLEKYPPEVIDHFEKGAFVTSLSGTNWSRIFLDEAQETTINKDIKERVKSLSNASMTNKLHYAPYGAKLHRHFMKWFEPKYGQPKQYKDSPSFAGNFELSVKRYIEKLKESFLFKAIISESDDSNTYSQEKLPQI
jgi:hypothetical protein